MSGDVIGELAGICPGSAVAAIRGQRQKAMQAAQASFEALFEPETPGNLSVRDRFSVAVFVALLHAQPEVAAFYRGRLSASGAPAPLMAAIDGAGSDAGGHGPYGAYPPGPLSREDAAGPGYRVAGPQREALGPLLAAGLEHAHLLVFHPRDATPAHLQTLIDTGWSTTGIVTLSQLVAFLAFQIRTVAGLRALTAHV